MDRKAKEVQQKISSDLEAPRLIIVNTMDNSKTAYYIGFVDLEKVLENVNWREMLQILENVGISTEKEE